MAAVMLGIYILHDRRIITEEHMTLVIFLAVPIAAFLFSKRGQYPSAAGIEHGQDDEFDSRT